jgi:hypothetical protein
MPAWGQYAHDESKVSSAMVSHLLCVYVLNPFPHSWDAFGIPGSLKVFSVHLQTSARMSKAASDTDGVTYSLTTHKSLLYTSPCMHVVGVHDMEVYGIKETFSSGPG